MTNDVVRRFHEHNSGHEKTTKPYGPFLLIYSEESIDRPTARIREKYWKSGSGRRKMRIIRDDILGGSNLPA